MANKKLTEPELLAAISQAESQSQDQASSRLSRQRAAALSYYQGGKYGNERDGRSQFVTREVMDTIEWIMPYMMKTFFGSVSAVEFTPTGPEDIAAAQQETEYTNYVWKQRNRGFTVAYQWIKDALLQKNGIVKVWWDERETTEREEYEGLDEEGLDLLYADDDIKVIELEESLEMRLDPQLRVPVPTPTYAAVCLRTNREGEARVEPVPPEEFHISRGAINIQDADFVQQETEKTISYLRQLGVSEEKLHEISSTSSPTGTGTAEFSDERTVRHIKDDTDPYAYGDNPTAGTLAGSDPSLRVVTVKETYIRIDWDGDGVAELRKVISVGSTVIENEEVSVIPFAGWTPIIMSHKFYGMSVAETVMELQLLQSTLFRNMLDNQYLANNGRYEVVENMVNLDDLVHSRPNGYVRTKGQGMIKALPTPQLGPNAFRFLEWVNDLRERRTGVSGKTQGLDPSLMNSHTTGTQATLAMTAAQQKLELIARVFAETGLSDMFRLLHGVLLQHRDKEDIFRLRNQYVVVDPSQWKERKDMTVTVGIGNLSPEMQLAKMDSIAGLLERIEAQGAGLVTKQNVYDFTNDYIRLINPSAVGRYISPPPPPEPPPPDPAMEVAKAQAEALKTSAEAKVMDAGTKQQKVQLDAQIAQARAAMDRRAGDLEELRFRLEQERQAFEEEKFEWQQHIEQLELEIEAAQKRGVDIG